MAVFKVFFQEDIDTRIIREDTQIRYVEAETEEEVRNYLKTNQNNIEFIQALSPAHLEYEQNNNEDFKVETIA
ncbi:DNA-dependent RNA polymerase subunit epsilon [Jeotgalicoccus halotolerans]|uniref:DNA-directed RNA polymerase subunit epsilon n=1 Tax=Jeotgalicoccus halotolerans TaxID=157227 RepID=A0A3E0AR12_9STAP|nr:RNA polymerase epsilon subunit [Jeotgalicoccus halotolerans]REG20627.1 DNA-dependent RNA polymerase auxiliary subunit epsilon [Jeotgalicoccus halotolerans]